MPNSQMDQAVHEAVAKTLEEMALMFLVPEDESELEPNAQRQQVAVHFTGFCEGECRVSVSKHLLGELTGNMLGLEAGDAATQEQEMDAVKELANVICGNVLPRIAGVDAVFHVGAPSLVEQASSASPPYPRAGEATVLVEGGCVEAEVYMEAAA